MTYNLTVTVWMMMLLLPVITKDQYHYMLVLSLQHVLYSLFCFCFNGVWCIVHLLISVTLCTCLKLVFVWKLVHTENKQSILV